MIKDMCVYNSNRIQKTIVRMKEIKKSSFYTKNDFLDFKKVLETCRIVDTFLLPLYYIWEHCCHRQLKEIEFEEHLMKPYILFNQAPITYTLEMFLYITLCTQFVKCFGEKNVCEIESIYKKFLENSKLNDTK